jgi:hypothetical protein
MSHPPAGEDRGRRPGELAPHGVPAPFRAPPAPPGPAGGGFFPGFREDA